jgi:hypothetical protein
MPFYKVKKNVGIIWLGPLADKAQVFDAFVQYHAAWKRRNALLPKQEHCGYQHIADSVRRKLDDDEVMNFPDTINELVRGLPCFEDVAKKLLSSLGVGCDVWEWGIDPHMRHGRNSYSYGWCIVKDGQILSTLCHSSS